MYNYIISFTTFLNKNYNYERSISSKQNLGIIIDNSESMVSYRESISEIIDSINSNKLISNFNTIYFNLDSIIDYNDIVIDKKYTSYEMFSSFVKKNDLDQIILLSDGNVNYGSNINYDNYNKLKNLNIISFGDNDNNSISIKDVKLINDKNKILSKVKLKINSQKKLISEFLILESNSKKILVKDTVYLESGNYYTDFDYILNEKSTDKNFTFKMNQLILLMKQMIILKI